MSENRTCGLCTGSFHRSGFAAHTKSCQQKHLARQAEIERREAKDREEFRAQLETNFRAAVMRNREDFAMELERARVRSAVRGPALDGMAAAAASVLVSTVNELTSHSAASQRSPDEEDDAFRSRLAETAKSTLEGLTARKRKTIAKDVLGREGCEPLRPVKRTYGTYPVRRAKKKGEKDSTAQFQAVVVDLPLEEQVRQRAENDPEFARMLFSERESIDGVISDWWDCGIAKEHPCVDPMRRHSCPVQGYTGMPHI